MNANATRLLDNLRYHGSMEWQSLHSDMHGALEELKAAGLAVEKGHRIYPTTKR